MLYDDYRDYSRIVVHEEEYSSLRLNAFANFADELLLHIFQFLVAILPPVPAHVLIFSRRFRIFLVFVQSDRCADVGAY